MYVCADLRYEYKCKTQNSSGVIMIISTLTRFKQSNKETSSISLTICSLHTDIKCHSWSSGSGTKWESDPCHS